MTGSELTDERLRDIARDLGGDKADGFPRAWVKVSEFRAILTELIARRTTTGEAVADRDSIRIAKQFADMYRSGAQGAEMDYDSAQHLALAIDDVLAHPLPSPQPAVEPPQPVVSERALRSAFMEGRESTWGADRHRADQAWENSRTRRRALVGGAA